MILHDAARMTFHLQGATCSYIIAVEDGVLQHVYWGAKLPDAPLDGLLVQPGWGASFDPAFGRQPLEVPTQEKGYYGARALDIRNAEGDDVVSLRYAGHRIFAGKKALDGLPSSYAETEDEAQTLEIDLIDSLTDVAVTLSYTVWADYDVLARSMRITNGGASPLCLRDAQTAVHLPADDWEIIHLKGAWARERHAQRIPMPQANFAIESRRGASGHENNPFLALVHPHTTEDAGDAYAVTHVYSGSFRASVDVGIDRAPYMMIGLNSDVFAWTLASGETFQAPEALLAFAPDGLNGLSRRTHAFIRKRICRGVWRDQPRPVLINNWEATYFGFTADKLVDIARKGAEIGCELFVMDDGWFGVRNDDCRSLGDWTVNETKLPGGVADLCRRVNDLGMQLGVWFEPEMVSPDSNLYRAHPDWCLHVAGRDRSEARQQLILDMSRAEVQDYVIEAVSAVLRAAPIAYVKWDMNRNMMEGFSAALPAEKRMESQHRYMLGLYRVLEEITSAFPQVLFESCSGGGGRFDCGLLCYMPQTWTSDDTDASERIAIQYGTSLLYPCSAMGAHVSAVPNHQTGRVTPFHSRCIVAMGGNFGFELDLNRLTEEEIACAKRFVALVKQVRATVQQGDYARLTIPVPGCAAWQFTDGENLILCIYQDKVQPNAQPWRVKPVGLDADAVYADAEHGLRVTGGALMHLGLPAPAARQDHDSWVYVFRKG